MQPEDASGGAVSLDVISLAIRELAAIEDPIAFDRKRKMVAAEHGLTQGAVDEAVKRERTKLAAAKAPERLDDAQAQAEIVRLSKLNPLTEARECQAVADRIGISVGTLRDLIKRERGEEPGQGKPIELPDPEPWDEPVNGAALLDGITREIKRYMVMDPGMAEVIALWSLHAHTLDAFMISPRLAITSPRPGCGKTTLLDILNRIVPRPLQVANVSAAAIYRTVEVARPTLLADEADTWLQGDDALRGILNAGHRRGGDVIRITGDDLVPRQFATWCACAIAMLGKLPATLADRSISVGLQRKRPDEEVERFRFDRTEELDTLARMAARWAKDNRQRIAAMDPVIPEVLSNRSADNWRTLFSLADAAGGAWPKRARDIAVATVDADQSTRTNLLADVRDVFELKASAELSSQELAEALVAMEGHDWADYRDGKALTRNQLARLLARDGISPGTIWLKDKRSSLKGYKRAQFEDAFSRYLTPLSTPTPPSHPNTNVRPSGPAENLVKMAFSETSGDLPPNGSKRTRNPSNSAPPDGLTDHFDGFSGPEPEINIEDSSEWRGDALEQPDNE